MSAYGGGNGAFKPATNQDSWVLDADTAGDTAHITEIGWGGRLTASTGYRTRWSRPTTNAASTFTSLAPQAKTPNSTPLCRLGTFATAATLAADPSNLYATDWNAHGGIGFVAMPIAQPWLVVNSATAGHGQVTCRNVAGTDANGSSYTVSWVE